MTTWSKQLDGCQRSSDVLSMNLNMRFSLNKSFYRSDELCKHVEHGSKYSKITGLTTEHSLNTAKYNKYNII